MRCLHPDVIKKHVPAYRAAPVAMCSQSYDRAARFMASVASGLRAREGDSGGPRRAGRKAEDFTVSADEYIARQCQEATLAAIRALRQEAPRCRRL